MAVPVYRGPQGLPPPPTDGARVVTRPEAAQLDSAQASIDSGIARTEAAAAEALRLRAEESRRQREAAAAQMADPQAYAAGTIGAANADFDAALGALGARNPTYQAPRPFYAPQAEYNDRMGELIPEAEQAFEGQQRAELGQARESLAITGEMANRQQEMLVEMRSRDQAEAQRKTAAMEKLNAAQTAATQAADDFAAHADVDPRRGWTSMSAGMKFLAILSAGLMGAVGMDPFAHIQSAIQEDIAAQQANIAKRSQVARAKLENVQGQRSVYADFVAQLGDERSAALSYENARLQQFMTQMSGRLQAAGIQTLTAEQQQLKNQFEQQIAANNLELGKRIEANTPTVTVGGGPALNAAQRQLVTAAGKQALTDRSAARESIVDTAGRREEEAAKLEAQRGAAPDPATRRVEASQRQFVVTQTRARREELRQLETFRKKYSNEIPGFVWGVGWTRPKPGEINPLWGKEEEEAYQSYKRPLMIRLRGESGAAIGASEEAKDQPFGGQNMGGKTVEEISAMADEILGSHNSEESLLADVDRRIEEARADIDQVERGVEESVNAEVNRSIPVARDPRSTGGGTAPTSEVWEE